MPSNDLSRVALVTGAARGIGEAVVDALCEAGYGVAAIDGCAGGAVPPGIGYPLASPEQLEGVARRYPGQVLPIYCDVRDASGLADAVAATLERFGRLDVAVAAAGVIAGGAPLWETPADQLKTLFDINTMGVWNTCAAVVPAMLAGPDRSDCRIVVITSAAGEHGLFRLSGYSASKHAAVGIVRGLAADLVGTGITAVAVAPGSTDTAMLKATADIYATTPQELASHQTIQRLIEPAEIAATVAFCCSSPGAILNGSVIRADGGFTG